MLENNIAKALALTDPLSEADAATLALLATEAAVAPFMVAYAHHKPLSPMDGYEGEDVRVHTFPGDGVAVWSFKAKAEAQRFAQLNEGGRILRAAD